MTTWCANQERGLRTTPPRVTADPEAVRRAIRRGDGLRAVTWHAAVRRLARALGGLAAWPFRRLRARRHRRRLQDELLALDDRMLEDIGLTRLDALRAGARGPGAHASRTGDVQTMHWSRDTHLHR